jgi:DNA-binding transcriptional MerR regulator
VGGYYIKDLESLTGIKAHTIRIWEQRYHLVTPKRTSTNIRYYDDDDVKLLLNIALLNKKGVKISKIACLDAPQIHSEALKVCEKRNENDNLINALTYATLNLDEESFNDVFTGYSEKVGFDKTITDLAFPFLQRLGDLWLSNALHPALEHFASNLIKRKIQNKIETFRCEKNSNKNFLLLLPPGELHELSLLYSHYVIKSRGYQVIYFGQNTPMNDLFDSIKMVKIDYVLSVFTSCNSEVEPSKFVAEIKAYCPDANIILAGVKLQREANPCFKLEDNLENVTILKNPSDLNVYLDKVVG